MDKRRYYWATRGGTAWIVRDADNTWIVTFGRYNTGRRYASPQQALRALIAGVSLAGVATVPATEADLPQEIESWHWQ